MTSLAFGDIIYDEENCPFVGIMKSKSTGDSVLAERGVVGKTKEALRFRGWCFASRFIKA